MFKSLLLFALLGTQAVLSAPFYKKSELLEIIPVSGLEALNFHPACNKTQCHKAIVSCMNQCICAIPTPECVQGCVKCVQHANEECCMCFHTCANSTSSIDNQKSNDKNLEVSEIIFH